MIIQVSGGNKGWGEYVLYGTANKPRDQSCVKVLRGDISLGDKIVKSGKWKENAYHVLLAFKGRVDVALAKEVLKEFEDQFMVGFNPNEYHMDAVFHTDTDDDHIHIRIPKMNLLTQTQLRLYFDRKDRPRLELIRDYLDLKYGLESPKDHRKFIREELDIRINQWREEQQQDVFIFSKKQKRIKSQTFLQKKVLEVYQKGCLISLQDVTVWLESKGLKVEKYGYDMPQNFHYVTVSNNTGKARLKGELFSKEFWEVKHTNEEISVIQKSSLETIVEKLKKVNAERIFEVGRIYKSARERAITEDEKILQIGKIKLEETETKDENKEDKNAESYRRIIQRIRTEREREKRDFGEFQKELTESYIQTLRDITHSRRSMEEECRENAENVVGKDGGSTRKLRELFDRVIRQIERVGNEITEFLKVQKSKFQKRVSKRKRYR